MVWTLTRRRERLLELLRTPMTTPELWDRMVEEEWLSWSTMYQTLARLHDQGLVSRLPEKGDQSIRPVMWWAI